MKRFIYLSCGLVMASARIAVAENFSNFKQGNFESISNKQGSFKALAGAASIYKKSANGKPGSLKINGGDDKYVDFELNEAMQGKELLSLSFQAERWTAAKPFKFVVSAKQNGEWIQLHKSLKTQMRSFSAPVIIPLKGKGYELIRFSANTAERGGLLIDNIILSENKAMEIKSVKSTNAQIPLLIRKENASILSVNIEAEGAKKADSLKEVSFDTKGTNHASVTSYSLYFGKKKLASSAPADVIKFAVNQKLTSGSNVFKLVVNLKSTASFTDKIHAKPLTAILENNGKQEIKGKAVSQRIGYNMAHSGDMVKRTNGEMMACKRFRIPGMVTTNKGTILAVYDLRWKQDGDLPGDLDVGLSRSTDGGKSWETPRPIMDMGNYLGEPEDKNGVGDPAILVDRKTGDVYVVALLAHGLNRGWYWGLSKPGMDPKKTGQCIIIKSTDDGKTWSAPKNITKSIKDPAWQLMLDGPGAGITTKAGTLVFAFQYKVPKGKGFSGNSALLYSKDHGKTWTVSAGVPYPRETTEAQVVELNDGSLMLNCRISSGGRAVFTTKDLGKTWKQHKTSGSKTFHMSGCMSSILRYSSTKNGDKKDILLFSGPADGGKKRRSHMSIRYSLDEGETWSKPFLLDEIGGAYSCLTLVENNGKKDIAIVYEGSQANMTFEVITLEELMRK